MKRIPSSIVLLALVLLPSCAATTLVRVVGPEGTSVAIGRGELQAVPFEQRVKGRQRVRISMNEKALRGVGLTEAEAADILKSDRGHLEGIVVVQKTPDEFAELKLEDESLKKAVLNYARFTWEYWDTRKRVILRFDGKAKLRK